MADNLFTTCEHDDGDAVPNVILLRMSQFEICLEIFRASNSYRPPGGGVSVDPLGEGLIRLLPDGFTALFAPAVALPALLFRLVPADPPSEVPAVVPVVADPVVVPLVADPPAAAPPADPLPLWAKATVLESASAAASPMLVNFMMSFLLL